MLQAVPGHWLADVAHASISTMAPHLLIQMEKTPYNLSKTAEFVRQTHSRWLMFADLVRCGLLILKNLPLLEPHRRVGSWSGRETSSVSSSKFRYEATARLGLRKPHLGLRRLRSNGSSNSPLKSAELAARGIPSLATHVWYEQESVRRRPPMRPNWVRKTLGVLDKEDLVGYREG